MKELELECIYTRWIALELVKQGFKIIKKGTNEYHPEYDTYYFERTPQFVSAFHILLHRGRR